MLKNYLNVEESKWERVSPLLEEYNIVLLKVLQLNAKKQFDLADMYNTIQNKLSIEIQNIFEEK